MWWAVTTITTVGYGDHFPRTAAGRGVAAALMISGIALFGIITASIAAYFVEHDSETGGSAPQLQAQLEQISDRLAAIERRLGDNGGDGARR
jgi:voltage-gated potassium channel